jgi:branched-chain amino acid aminotransferase
VFETMRIVDGAAFALGRHLRRLDRSASGLGLDEPDEDLIRAAIHEVLAADPSAGLLRITWSSGAGPWGSGRGSGPGTLVVASGPPNVWPAAERVHLVAWRRNEHGPLVGLKTTSYAENVLALATARRVGCSEALFANTAGRLCEGTGTNVFLVVDGAVVTPPLSSGCLAGVTRELVMELADVVERDIDPAGFATADEAFLTSSTRDVSPISAVDGVELPAAPGPVTAGLMAAFADLVSRTTDP